MPYVCHIIEHCHVTACAYLVCTLSALIKFNLEWKFQELPLEEIDRVT